ncbi:unnamed protein product [Hyaloperonospora brassicae]|uniref:Large ribosomal subunit protein bL32m n=1 Tax=Hyaloperonospora brassicae TaxID=162125 RepID=A0AAV0UKT1_HYABA|nr:unnamed protein product [Hyaloperonospora brassicae]
MAATRVHEAIQRFLQRALFPRLQTPSPIVSPLALNNASSALSSNGLHDFIWLAAPKSKVTPSRKRIRNNDLSKRLKNIVHFQVCSMCGEKKLRHRLCMSCYKQGKYFV